VAVANGSHGEASGLTARQQQALEWKQSGLKTKEIAHKMGISVPGAAYLVRAAEKNSTNPNPKTKETK
jgi:DNA-binding CsgD family transcriptional regulator